MLLSACKIRLWWRPLCRNISHLYKLSTFLQITLKRITVGMLASTIQLANSSRMEKRTKAVMTLSPAYKIFVRVRWLPMKTRLKETAKWGKRTRPLAWFHFWMQFPTPPIRRVLSPIYLAYHPWEPRRHATVCRKRCCRKTRVVSKISCMYSGEEDNLHVHLILGGTGVWWTMKEIMQLSPKPSFSQNLFIVPVPMNWKWW